MTQNAILAEAKAQQRLKPLLARIAALETRVTALESELEEARSATTFALARITALESETREID